MFQCSDLIEKNILVTGASSGIGRAIAIGLSQMGANVILVARSEKKLEETLSLMEGSTHTYFTYDFSDTGGIESLIKLIVSQKGPLYGLVYCAGYGGLRPLNRLRTKDIQEMMTVNFYSFVEMVRCFSQKGNFTSLSSIVGISSVASEMGDKGKISYCSSKAAMDASVRCMAKELAPKGIRINNLRPSWVKTNLLEQYKKNWADSQVASDFFSRHLFGIVEPEQVADLVAFLMTDSSKTITGSFFPIDSGSLL